MRKRSDRVELEWVPLDAPAQEEGVFDRVLRQAAEDAAGGSEYQSPGLEDSGEYLPRPDGKVHSDFYSTVLPKEDPDFYTIRQREEDVARGFSALSIGWNNENAEDNKQFRQDAVNAFGEEWVADWEKQDTVTQWRLAGMRYLTENYTMEGDVGHEALMRYNNAERKGGRYVRTEADVWVDIQKKGKKWYEGEVAKRKAEARAREENAERLDAILYDFISSEYRSMALTADQYNLLRKSGISLDTLNRARDAFSYASSSSDKYREYAAGIIGNDEKARQLMLGAVRKKAAEDEAWWEFKNPVANTLSAGVVKGVIRTAQSFFPDISPTSISGAEARSLPDTRLGEQGLEPRNFEQKRVLFLDSLSSPQGADSRARASIAGDIENAVQSGIEDHRKGTGFRFAHFAEVTVDTGAFILLLSRGKIKSIPKTSVDAIKALVRAAPASLPLNRIARENANAAASRGRGVPMSDEEFQQIANELGIEEAKRRKAIQERESSDAAVWGQAVLGSTAEIGAFMVAPKIVWGGVGRVFGTSHATTKLGQWAAGKAGKALGGTAAGRGVMAARTATGNALTRAGSWIGSTDTGATVMAIGRTTIDFGAMIPLASALSQTAVDAVIGDPKLEHGMEELAATWQELGKPEYWGEMAASSAIFGGAPAGAALLRARRAIDKLGRIYGLTDEQRREVKKEKPEDRVKKLAEFHEYNWKNDRAAALVRASKAAGEELNKQRAREMREDEIVMTALSLHGYSIERSGEEGQYWVYEGGTVDMETGKFTRGEKKVKMSEDDVDRFVDNVMGSDLRNGARLLKEIVAGKRTIDYARKELANKIVISYTPTMESLGWIKDVGEKAKERVEKRVKEIMGSEKGVTRKEAEERARKEIHDDIDKDLNLGELIDRDKSARIRAKQERAQRVEDEIARLKGENSELTDEEAREQAEANVGAVELGSRAHVVYRTADNTRVFRIANDSATPKDLAEELGEQILVDWMDSGNMSLREAYKTLYDLKKLIAGGKEERARRVEIEAARLKGENGKLTDEEARKQAEANVDSLTKGFLTLEKRNNKLHKRLLDDKITDSDFTTEEIMEARNEVLETLSDIFIGELSIEAEARGSNFPDWARELFHIVNTDGAAFVRDVKLAGVLADARAKGVMNEAARKLLGAAPEAIEKALRGNSTPSPDEIRRSYAERRNRQEQLDAEYGRKLHDPGETEEFAKKCDEGQKGIDEKKKQEEKQKSEQTKKDIEEIEKENPEMSHEQAVQTAGEKRADAQEEQTAADPAAVEDKDFSNGKCVELSEEGGLPVKAGMISTDKLQILPNFKLGADPDTGEVHPITGDYRGDHDPIRVWRKSDGTLMVISGRHRLAACRRAGVSRIMCYVYDESPARNEAWARRFDVESNIRDNQATPLEVALYVRGEFTEGKALTDDEIKRAGISREGTLGSIGYRIGRNAGETVISNMRNGTIDERQALWIADFAPGSDKVQAAGVRLAIEGASKGEIIARMEAEQAMLNMQDEMGLSGGTDLFGGALDNDEFNNFAAKYVNRRRNSLGQDISYLNKLVGKPLSKDQAKKYGINIKDPDGLRKALDKLRLEQAEWQNPWVRRELMDEIRDAWEKENPSVDGSGEATDSTGGKSGGSGTGGKGGGSGAGGASMSVTEAKERKLFDEKGVFVAGNALVVEPGGRVGGASFSETALHASPHDHDGFDTAHIGEGEGNKVYGWGVYAAENPAVNEYYKAKFRKRRYVEPKIFGVRIDTLDMKTKEAEELIERVLPEIRFSDPRNPFNRWNGSDLEGAEKQQLRDTVAKAITDARRLIKEGKADIYSEAFSILRKQKEGDQDFEYFGRVTGALENLIKTTAKEGGYTNYRVEILVEDDEFLKWDEPVPPKTRRKLLPLLKEARKKQRNLLKEKRKNPNKYTFTESECETLLAELNDSSVFESGERLYRKLTEALGSDKETSLGMDKLGVHGIKYLDGFSRDGKTKEKTHDFVVFNGNRVKITHKATEESNYEWREVDWKPAQGAGIGGASMSVTEVKRGGKEPPVFKMLDLYHKGDLRGGGSFSVTEAKEKKLFDEHGFMRASNGILFDGTSFVLTAMHASPHWIKDNFRMDKEGSGEGVQMFGSGMYFTENDRVNDKYLGQFKKELPPGWLVNGKRLNSLKSFNKAIPGFSYVKDYDWLDDVVREGLLPAARKRVRGNEGFVKMMEERVAEAKEAEERLVRRYKTKEAAQKRPGRGLTAARNDLQLAEEDLKNARVELEDAKKTLAWAEKGNTLELSDEIIEPAYNYRVEIDAEEGEFFYWDDKLGDEPNKGALEKLLNSPVEEVREMAGIVYGYVGDMTGEEFYINLTEEMRRKHGLNIYDRKDKAKAQRYASMALLASGIKGHKYADGFTRGKPRDQRKYNAVIWDMDAIKITHIARGNRDWKPREETGVGSVGGASMSVIGQRAKTFSKYLDKTFLGRDDGKMRAEIDASQARLKGAWTAPEDLDKLATRGERKKLDELRGAWERYKPIVRAKEPGKIAEKQALQGQASKLGKDLERLADRMLKELGYDFENAKVPALRDKARRHVLLGDVDWLRNDVDTSVYKKDKWKLGEVLDYPELFEAYPELAEIEVRDKYLSKGHYGSYNPDTRTITINEELPPDERRGTILHEVQHAIQDIEGFAEGSSPAAASDKRRRVDEARARVDKRSGKKEALESLPEDVKNIDLRTPAGWDEIKRRHEEAVRAMKDIRGKVLAKAKAEGRSPTDEEAAPLDKAVDLMLAYEELEKEYGNGWGNAEQIIDFLKAEIKVTQEQLDQVEGVRQDLSPYELYLRTPGEIESRNVQKRRDWTAERRQATPFNDTLEYPGEAVNFGSFSVTEAKEKKLFDEHGFMQAANGVLFDGTSFVLTAMHASPHWIKDNFRMDKEGSGEGAQMFGSGMYFTENDGVNDHYLDQFEKEDKWRWRVNGEVASSNEDLKRLVPGFAELNPNSVVPLLLESYINNYATLSQTLRELETATKLAMVGEKEHDARSIRALEKNLEEGPNEDQLYNPNWRDYVEEELKKCRAYAERHEKEFQTDLAALQKMKAWADEGNTLKRSRENVPAYNYRVEIDAEEGELFYWDDKMTDELNAGAWEKIRNSPVEKVRELAELVGKDWNADGGDFYWALTERMREEHKLGFSRKDDSLAARYASEALLASGIKGHKYADGFTRGKPRDQRKYNEVIWDMDAIKITHVARGNRDWKPREEGVGSVGGASMSVCGQRAKGWGAAESRGDVYLDRADGKRKFVISTQGVNFREPLTRGMLNVPAGGHKDVTLGNLIQYDELFENYPELRDVRVRLYKSDSDKFAGFYHAPIEDSDRARDLSVTYRHHGDAYIALNTGKNRTEKDWLNTLLHETQHAIQGIEGFAEGGSFRDEAGALTYVQKAIALRKKDPVKDSFKQENLAYLRKLEDLLKNGSRSEKDAATQLAYWYSHGEQEARYAGGSPNIPGDHPNVAAPKRESETIFNPMAVTDLGGLTFGWMGTFGTVLDRYMPASENFDISRRVFQMKESIVRRLREIELQQRGQSMGEDGAKLAAEGMAIIDSLEQLLPNTYRFALEPYKVYFSFYANLRGSGDAGKATRVIPMRSWDTRMKTAMENIAKNLIIGRIKQRDAEFFDLLSQKDRDTVSKLAGILRPQFDALMKASSSTKESKAKREKDALQHIWDNMMTDSSREQMLSMVGEMRAQGIMAKFLQRVNMQLDNYRKDVALGKIRRVVGNLTPAAGKDGRPVKGRISAENYNKVQDLMTLLELTPGEKARLDEKFEPEDGKTADPKDVLEVECYTQDGEPKTIRCTRQEWETYACFDSMSAGQAESMSHALGELITTGRQAWENAEEAEKAATAAKCAPAMEMFGETPEQRGLRRNREALSLMGHGPKMLRLGGYLMNDAQFFYALTGVDAIAGWAEDARHRIANAHLYMEQQEKRRVRFLADALRRASGANDEKGVAAWVDEVNRMQDTGVSLIPRKPDFLEREREELRRQFLGTLWRKTHQKNFRANTFAEALRTLMGQKDMPKELLKEAMDKYSTVGDARLSRVKGMKAVASVFTGTELKRFADLEGQARERARKAEEKWDKENKLGEPGRRTMSRAQAAYHVLLAEQADYREMMRRQGYTDEALRQLREFAGKDLMGLAEEMRAMMGERTAEMKDLYEKIYGMPFPEVDNYFRAYFDAGIETHNQTVLDNAGYGAAAGGGARKVFYTRKQHNRPIEPTMSLFNAFNAGMKEQDILLGYGTLPTELTSILNYKDGDRTMADALDNAIGRDAVNDLRAHVRNMTELAPAAEETARMMSRLLNALSSSQARSILNFRMGTLMKQKTAIFNTLAGSDLVSTGDWFRSMARVQAGLGKISPAEMAKRPELASRFKGWNTTAVMDNVRGHADLKVSGGASSSKVNAGMHAIEYIDMRANVKSACILYDAVWRNLKRDNPEWDDAKLDEAAMGEVRDALARKSQPLDWRQRSLLSTRRSVMKIGSLFLGGESINTVGHIASLVAHGKKGDYKRAAGVWLAHGAALQAITFLYNWLTDDEGTWERRRWQGYATGVLLGPLMGIPILSQGISLAAGAANQVLPKEWSMWMPTGSVLPMGDIERDIRTFKSADDWLDYTIAANTLVKDAAAVGAIASANSATLGQAKAKAVMYTAAAVSNIIDFLLRAARAATDRFD